MNKYLNVQDSISYNSNEQSSSLGHQRKNISGNAKQEPDERSMGIIRGFEDSDHRRVRRIPVETCA